MQCSKRIDHTFDFPAQVYITAGSRRVEFSLRPPTTLMRPQGYSFAHPIAFYGSSLDLRAASSLSGDYHDQDGAGLIFSGFL